jgi:hypothetical protein
VNSCAADGTSLPQLGYFLLFIGFFVIGQFNDPAKLGAADAIMTVIILVSRLGGAAHAG